MEGMSSNRGPRARRFVALVALFAVLAAAALIRARLLDVPLERDEGEFAYTAQLIMDGVPPYGELYTMKLPGTALAYAAAISLFGETARAIHLGLLIVSALSTVLLFLLARRLMGDLPALLSSAIFALLSLSPQVLGMHAHATHFVVLFALAGLLLVASAVDFGGWWKPLVAGFLLGVGFLMKQNGIFFVLFALAFLAWSLSRKRPIQGGRLAGECALLLAGAALPFAVACLWLWRAGVFEPFWFWTFTYARLYAAGPGEVGIGTFASRGLPLLAAAALLVFLFLKLNCRKSAAKAFFVLGFLLFSIASILPGLNFRKHYFVLILPAASLAIGALAEAIDERIRDGGISARLKHLAPLFVVAGLGILLFLERGYLFLATPSEASRMVYGANPFAEAEGVAARIDALTEPGDKIAILGSEPEILFYAKRRSATGYIYMYELMERHPFAERMQRQMIEEIERARPAVIVEVGVEPSWSPRFGSPRIVFDWFEKAAGGYELVDATAVANAPEQFVKLFVRGKTL